MCLFLKGEYCMTMDALWFRSLPPPPPPCLDFLTDCLEYCYCWRVPFVFAAPEAE